jgi:glutaredoxin-related protein
MQEGKSNVKKTYMVEITNAQKELLNLLKHKEAEEYFLSLKKVHYLGTYCMQPDMVELAASSQVHDLLDAIQEISIEYSYPTLSQM